MVATLQPEPNYSQIYSLCEVVDNVKLITYTNFQNIMITECNEVGKTLQKYPHDDQGWANALTTDPHGLALDNIYHLSYRVTTKTPPLLEWEVGVFGRRLKGGAVKKMERERRVEVERGMLKIWG